MNINVIIQNVQYEMIPTEDGAGFTLSELNTKSYTWKDCFIGTQGYYIHNRYGIVALDNYIEYSEKNRDVFLTEKQAKSAMAFAQLTHIMNKVYVNFNWIPDWGSDEQEKAIIIRMNNKIHFDMTWCHYSFLAFPTSDIRDLVYDQNKELIHEYLMLEFYN